MQRRYWVTYRRQLGSEVLTNTEYLGRFESQMEADAIAKDRYQYYLEVVGTRGETALEAYLYVAKRFLIRSLRVVSGVGMGLLVYAFVLEPMPEVFDMPLASLTLGSLLGAAFRIVVGLALMSAAWLTAFGDGPSPAS